MIGKTVEFLLRRATYTKVMCYVTLGTFLRFPRRGDGNRRGGRKTKICFKELFAFDWVQRILCLGLKVVLPIFMNE